MKRGIGFGCRALVESAAKGMHFFETTRSFIPFPADSASKSKT